MNRVVSRVLFAGLLVWACSVPRASATMPVIDYAAIVQLIKQVEQTVQMIKQLESLTHYAELDHISLAGKKFHKFLTDYKALFDKIINEVEGYQNGGLLGQIERLDEVYAPYHTDWEHGDETEALDPLRRQLKKQLLWTRIQFKHAANVAAQVRESLPNTEEQIQGFLTDTREAVGIMQTIKIGNELTGMVARTLQNLNVQLTEVIQAQAAEGLQRNQTEGHQKNRSQEALKDFGKPRSNTAPAPLNPVGAY